MHIFQALLILALNVHLAFKNVCCKLVIASTEVHGWMEEFRGYDLLGQHNRVVLEIYIIWCMCVCLYVCMKTGQHLETKI